MLTWPLGWVSLHALGLCTYAGQIGGFQQLDCEYFERWAVVRTLHQVINHFLAHSVCRLDMGALCRNGRDGKPFMDGRSTFAGSDGEWAISGHTGDSIELTKFLFDVAFRRAPRRICEVGFNVGHSAVTLLAGAGNNSSYLGFDFPRLNTGINEEFFKMLQAWLGPGRQLEMYWGDAAISIPRYLAENQAHTPGCELIFYDGGHDILSVLRRLSLLRQLAARRNPMVVLDDVRCDGPLCGHSDFAWDFLVWAGLIEELHCRSFRSVYAASPGHDFGVCVGRFRWGPRAVGCSVFDAWCVAKTYTGAYLPGSKHLAWSRCCLSKDHAAGSGTAAMTWEP